MISQEKFQDLILTDEKWIDIMLENPILIERPIAIKDGKAIIHSLEKIVNLLSDK
ncbi:hypothetical protein LZQ00_10985 [Sphingobacterium sp. SRCM116780]|uniref:ArsC/Spx/MgsR family protein n=1 Tax=Sphingobacterium sp. SRCM116780 TaxID=2907623 RepID=UPI001F3BD8C7|nr:ArsC/Spx/MgsR family protein [Sphingobacterium sp. SRCM116780]UIR54801.1 hypothetical protein LZQ00_10985 [Sphingobacterium sp. SRCM116780]